MTLLMPSKAPQAIQTTGFSLHTSSLRSTPGLTSAGFLEFYARTAPWSLEVKGVPHWETIPL